jgi:hypothetical protein
MNFFHIRLGSKYAYMWLNVLLCAQFESESVDRENFWIAHNFLIGDLLGIVEMSSQIASGESPPASNSAHFGHYPNSPLTIGSKLRAKMMIKFL